jgi:hypothetical protein
VPHPAISEPAPRQTGRRGAWPGGATGPRHEPAVEAALPYGSAAYRARVAACTAMIEGMLLVHGSIAVSEAMQRITERLARRNGDAR